MNKKIALIIVGILLVGILAGGIILRGGNAEQDKSKKTDETLEITTNKDVLDNQEEVEPDKNEMTGSSETRSQNGKIVPSDQASFLAFPREITGTQLVIQEVQAYSGSFVEDGSNDEMANIVAILVKNTGSDCVEYGEIRMESGETEHVFTFSLLESGESCVVLEETAASFSGNNYTSCSAQVVAMETREMSEDSVKVTETKNGALQIKNISDEKIPCIRIFYKNYSEEDGVYIGGIAYNAKVTGLDAGYTQLVNPSHYVAGQSKVLMVRTYESEE